MGGVRSVANQNVAVEQPSQCEEVQKEQRPVVAGRVVEKQKVYDVPQPDKWLAKFRKTRVPDFDGAPGSKVE